MEVMFLRARRAVEIALDKSREMQLKDLAEQASKKADQLKDLAGRMKTTLAPPSFQSTHNDQLLERYGITPELQDFVRGLTIETFRDFYSEDTKLEDTETLSPWKEQHALLVLSAVPELSRLRYQLCPKIMKDKRFWRIYFTLVDGRIARYVDQQRVEPGESTEPEEKCIELQSMRSEPEIIPIEESRPSASSRKSKMTDEELDIYLTSGLDNSDDEYLAEDEGGILDAELEELVKDAGLDNDDEKPTQ